MTSLAEIDSPPRRRLLVFADDWGRHPSSCQHLVRQLLPRRRVAWVDTIGMRTPALNWATVSRGVEKLAHWLGPKSEATESLPPQLTVLRPRMWPWFTRRLDRALNRRLLSTQLGRWCRAQEEPVTAVTTLPIVADLMGVLPVERWVYYCVDDFSQWPGVDQATMLTMERIVVDKADVLIAVSRHLQERLAALGRSSELLTHGVDLEFWRRADAVNLPAEVESMERPWITFWGLVDRRMDVAFLRRLCERLTQGTVLLAGPESDPDPELARLPRVRRLPAQPLDVLPALGQASAVLVMPYGDLPVTRAMQPLKMLEYLATGRPVVARQLPSTAEWADCLDLAATPDEFASAVLTRIVSGIPAEQSAARQRLVHESWAAKAARFEEWLHGPASARLPRAG
jgi:glycosyltransferase involved in cell wall biosynthesis